MIKINYPEKKINSNFLLFLLEKFKILIRLFFSIIFILYISSKLAVCCKLMEKYSNYKEEINICEKEHEINSVCKSLQEVLGLKEEIKEVEEIKINNENQIFFKKILYFFILFPEKREMMKLKSEKIKEINEMLKKKGIKNENIKFDRRDKKWTKINDAKIFSFIRDPRIILFTSLNFFSKNLGVENSFFLDVIIKVTLCNLLYFFLSSKKPLNILEKDSLIDVFINFSILFCTKFIIYSSFLTNCNLPKYVEEMNITSWFIFFLIPTSIISIIEKGEWREWKIKNKKNENFIKLSFPMISGVVFFYVIEREKNMIIAIDSIISNINSILFNSNRKGKNEVFL